MFFNELDLLEIRLNELDPVVDVFVLVEATRTFQGDTKPLVFSENRERFDRFLPKIRTVVVDDGPDGPDAWAREHHQRNAVFRALDDAASDDLVIAADLDEIPSAHAVRAAKARDDLVFFETPLHIYYLNWVALDWPGPPWTAAFAASMRRLRELGDLNISRTQTPAQILGVEDPGDAILPRAGWHFSYMGGVAGVLAKMSAYSHTEPVVQQWNDAGRMVEAIEARRHFVNGATLTPLPIDERLPAFVRTHAVELADKGLIRFA
jgi:beta-1,4-mannosyl-glycoprotein beta-1,4-N-acetylglucosaminyltransferase